MSPGQGCNLSGGLRVAHDRQRLDAHYVVNGFPNTLPAFQQHNTFSDTYLTGRMALSYEGNERAMSSVSLARGYASGGLEKTTSYADFGMLTEAFLPSENTLSGSYQFVGTRYAEIQNAAKMDDYHLLNAEIGWEKENFRVYAFSYPALMQGGQSGTTAYSGEAGCSVSAPPCAAGGRFAAYLSHRRSARDWTLDHQDASRA